jgi:hypothetical protein
MVGRGGRVGRVGGGEGDGCSRRADHTWRQAAVITGGGNDARGECSVCSTGLDLLLYVPAYA